ncbi:hypothetical protein [Bradyrhizobium sp. LB13.1]
MSAIHPASSRSRSLKLFYSRCSLVMTVSSVESNGLPCAIVAAADGINPNDIVGIFKKHRATIEQIASDQYDAGKEMPVVRTEHLGAV